MVALGLLPTHESSCSITPLGNSNLTSGSISQTLVCCVLSKSLFFNTSPFRLYLYPGRSVLSPWEYFSSLGLMVWPLTSRGNLWTHHQNHGDSTTLAIHSPTPAWRYYTHTSPEHFKRMASLYISSYKVQCYCLSLDCRASHGSDEWHHPQFT